MKKMDTRKKLLKALESLPEYQVPLVLAYIQCLQKGLKAQEKRIRTEMIYEYMKTVPEEDYELSHEELRSIEQGRQAIREGKFHQWEDVEKELQI